MNGFFVSRYVILLVTLFLVNKSYSTGYSYFLGFIEVTWSIMLYVMVCHTYCIAYFEAINKECFAPIHFINSS